MFGLLRCWLRVVRRAPRVMAPAVVVLAVGIAGNAVIFSVVDAALLRPLPFDNPNALVVAEARTAASADARVAYDDYLDWRRSGVFEDLAATGFEIFSLTGAVTPEQAYGSIASPSLFHVLRVSPFMGRLFTPDDDRPTSAPVVLVTYTAWRAHFHADPNVVGRTVVLDRRARTIVGVLPPRVRYPANDDTREFFVPLGATIEDVHARGAVTVGVVVGRLKHGETIGQAQAGLSAVASTLARQYPATNRDIGVRVSPLRDSIVGPSRTLILALWGAVALVLIASCANAGMLMAALGAARSREFAIRAAIGARRSHLVRQLLVESVATAGTAGAIGLFLAWIALPLVARMLPSGLPGAADVQMDGRVLGFALLVTLATGLAAGLVPAWQTGRTALAHAASARQPAIAVRPRARAAFVVVQLAVTQALLVVAGLLVATLVHLIQIDPGIRADHVAVALYYLPDSAYVTHERMVAFHHALLDDVGHLPGVEAAGLLTPPPFGFGQSQLPVVVEGRQEAVAADYFRASPSILETLDVPLRDGRFFDDHDRRGSLPVAVIDERFAQTVFSGVNPIGRRVRLEQSKTWLSIVGVVGHVGVRSLDDPGRPQLWEPLLATSTHFTALMVRTATGDPMTLMPQVREAARGLDPDLPLFSAAPMAEMIGRTTARQRFGAYVFALFALAAWLLAAIGLGTAVGYSVTIRTQEIGIRLALGADPRLLVRRLVAEGGSLTLAGAAAGLAAGVAGARALSSLLVGVRPFDPWVLVLSTAALVATGVVSSYLPARRAGQVDPLEALRAE
ncbi:MAG: ABC transporter permease [Vicinamibacterales bacterium]